MNIRDVFDCKFFLQSQAYIRDPDTQRLPVVIYAAFYTLIKHIAGNKKNHATGVSAVVHQYLIGALKARGLPKYASTSKEFEIAMME